eukprot:scaffold1.g5202.t1
MNAPPAPVPRGGAHAASRTLQLLELLGRILAQLCPGKGGDSGNGWWPPREGWRGVPLVCQRLSAAVLSCRELWQDLRLSFDNERKPDAQYTASLLRWLSQRLYVLDTLELNISHSSWLGVAASALAVTATAPYSIRIFGPELAGPCTSCDVTQLLAPLPGAVQLQELDLDLWSDSDVQPLSTLPFLGHLHGLERLEWRAMGAIGPPPGLEVLTGLTRLSTDSCTREWLPAVARMVWLRDLELLGCTLPFADPVPEAYELSDDDLDFLPTLPDLTRLQLEYMDGLRGLAPAILNCTQLQNLYLIGIPCWEWGCLGGLSRLCGLTALSIRDVGLEALPAPISTLTKLQTLDLVDNDDLRLSLHEVCTSLAALTELTALSLPPATVRAVPPGEWLWLKAAAPGLALPEDSFE